MRESARLLGIEIYDEMIAERGMYENRMRYILGGRGTFAKIRLASTMI
jgi:hypothetical protein